jgi:hypothetical protein
MAFLQFIEGAGKEREVAQADRIVRAGLDQRKVAVQPARGQRDDAAIRER